MKLSIFPTAKAHPSSKTEKVKEAAKFSAPFLPQELNIANEDELISAVTTYAWSPAIFSGTRRASNFVSSDFLVYDIDEGLTIDGADEILKATGYCYLILPSPSHTPEAHRFRVIMPMSHSIRDLDTFNATWKTGANILKVVDPSCSDSSRAYFGSTLEDGFWQGGNFIEPVRKQEEPKRSGFVPSQVVQITVTEDLKELTKKIYGKERDSIPEAVDYFIRNAHTGLPGNWISALNSFCFSLSLSKVEDDDIIAIVESIAPESLTDRDNKQIERSIRDGKKASV